MKKRKISIGKSTARVEFTNIIGSTEKVRQNAFYRIKRKLIFPELCDAADFLDKNLHIPFRKLLFGNPLPNSYESLGDTDIFPFFRETNKQIFPLPKLQSEVNWIFIGIRKYTYQINLFLSYKEIYERELLLGNYQDAEKYLGKIENEVCFSVWTLENRFLLKEMSNSSVESKKLLNTFNEDNKSKTNTKFLAHFLCIKSEKSLSINRYFSDFQVHLDDINGELRDEHVDYLRFKLSYLNSINYQHYQAILLIDFGHSIIDRYLSLIAVFTNILTLTNHTQRSEEITGAISYISNRVNYLLRKVNDPILYKLSCLQAKNYFPLLTIKTVKKKSTLLINIQLVYIKRRSKG